MLCFFCTSYKSSNKRSQMVLVANNFICIFLMRKISFIFSCYVFLISYFLADFFYLGDQQFYNKFYQDSCGLNLSESFFLYQNILGSSEVGYFFVVHFVSCFVNKILFNSLVNAVFSYLIVFRMLQLRVSYIFIFFLSTNFYFLVILLSAERLKFCLFFVMIFFLYKPLVRYFYLLLSVLAHIQIVVILPAIFSKSIIILMTRMYHGFLHKSAIFFIIIFCFLIFVFLFYSSHITDKFLVYNSKNGGNVISELKPVLFFLLSIFYSRNHKMELIVSFIPIMVASYYVGSERLVVFSYFIFMYYVFISGKNMNIIVLIICFYFSVQGVLFINNIFLCNDGFCSDEVVFDR